MAPTCLGFSLLFACGGGASPAAPTTHDAPKNASPAPPPSASAPIRSTTATAAVPLDASVPAAPQWRAVALPGATPPVTLDYVAYEAVRGRVWIPVGDTGSVDVFDTSAGTFARVDGFKTAQREVHGKTRAMGPSAASVGQGVVYIGDRATGEVCSVSATTLTLGRCITLPAATDGVVYVAATKEVWVTTPKRQSLSVLDASKPDVLRAKLEIKTPGDPEGYAIDTGRGLFYTNLEDQDKTLAIDLRKHAIVSTWNAGCGTDGPRGVAVDSARGFVLVACTGAVHVLDAHGGAQLGTVDTGPGVDNIDFVESSRLLYVAAGKAARLSVLRIDDKGQPSIVAAVDTAEGARNAVADAVGNIYVADPKGARLLIVPSPALH